MCQPFPTAHRQPANWLKMAEPCWMRSALPGTSLAFDSHSHCESEKDWLSKQSCNKAECILDTISLWWPLPERGINILPGFHISVREQCQYAPHYRVMTVCRDAAHHTAALRKALALLGHSVHTCAVKLFSQPQRCETGVFCKQLLQWSFSKWGSFWDADFQIKMMLDKVQLLQTIHGCPKSLSFLQEVWDVFYQKFGDFPLWSIVVNEASVSYLSYF